MANEAHHIGQQVFSFSFSSCSGASLHILGRQFKDGYGCHFMYENYSTTTSDPDGQVGVLREEEKGVKWSGKNYTTLFSINKTETRQKLWK